MAEAIFLILSLMTSVILLGAGCVIGTTREVAHFKSLARREADYRNILQTTCKHLPRNLRVGHAELVQGQAVIASDYFKMFLAKLRTFFGGEVRSLESLMVRARREATLRMLEEARQMGAFAVWNIRMETSNIGRGTGGQGAPMAEVYVYGTALCYEPRR